MLKFKKDGIARIFSRLYNGVNYSANLDYNGELVVENSREWRFISFDFTLDDDNIIIINQYRFYYYSIEKKIIHNEMAGIKLVKDSSATSQSSLSELKLLVENIRTKLLDAGIHIKTKQELLDEEKQLDIEYERSRQFWIQENKAMRERAEAYVKKQALVPRYKRNTYDPKDSY